MSFLFWCIILFLQAQLSLELNSTILNRRKRYAAFPDGSSLSVALCMSQQVIIPAGSIFTEGVNWGIGYQLPNKTTYLDELKEKKHIIRRRDRRNLYEQAELILEQFGYNGKPCIYRALCEAPKKFTFKDKNIPERIVNVLFKYPLDRIEDEEPEEHRNYHWASRIGQDNIENCEKFINQCPISLIDIVLSFLSGHEIFE